MLLPAFDTRCCQLLMLALRYAQRRPRRHYALLLPYAAMPLFMPDDAIRIASTLNVTCEYVQHYVVLPHTHDVRLSLFMPPL